MLTYMKIYVNIYLTKEKSMGAEYTTAQAKAAKKYVDSLDVITVKVKGGSKERWKSAAEKAGYKSLTKFIQDCIEEYIEKQEGR